jgi:two-component system CheB/CheR fusion protein
VGASLGGLDAFTRLVRALPSDTGFAFVLVQHLDPAHESLLSQLLARVTKIPVVEAANGMKLAGNRIYVIPPNTQMTVGDGHLRLVARAGGRGPHLPIDAFLTSLAEVHGSDAIGVVLSGAGSDGTAGIAAIREAGGITMVQDSQSARDPAMPESAIGTGGVDFILSPEEIADHLARMAAQLAQNGAGASPTPQVEADETLRQILSQLYARHGVDFQNYRRSTVERRIFRRMCLLRQTTRREYLTYVDQNPAELDLLYDDLLIGVTSFFRDPDVFASLRATALPALLARHPVDTPFRVWVVGCATGEEVYSIAITLLECMSESGTALSVQIFGTDLSTSSIATARAGLYRPSIRTHVSAERLRRFFVEEATGYRISKAVRDLCVFSRQNVLYDPPFAHLDLISCRNVLIYLEPSLQHRVFAILRYAIEPTGLLLLGSAESVGASSELFDYASKADKLFKPRGAARPVDVGLRAPARVTALVSSGTHRQAFPVVRALPSDEVMAVAEKALMDRFVPPGVLINDHLDILQFRGDTTPFLVHPPGVPSLRLPKMARAELVAPLHAALHAAKKTQLPVREDRIAITDDGGVRHVRIDVVPLKPSVGGGQYYLVLFEQERDVRSSLELARGGKSGRGARGPGDAAKALRSVTDELLATRRRLQSLVEEHEASTEELRAANEEVQSSNEELQSTNEELETTKEEVQSTNEELTTLNEELNERNRDLGTLTSDLLNILSSTTMPILIVGSNLRLKRFTPSSDKVFRVIATDVGRPLADLKLRVNAVDLEASVRQAIDRLTVSEQDVQDEEGRWWRLTVRPYQTVDRHVDGAVLVFADIDAAKRHVALTEESAEERRMLLAISEEARAAAERANRTKGTFLASMSHDLRTPLNAIAGYAELMSLGLRGPVTTEQQADLARIQSSARHLLTLINDILNFAKVEAGHLQINTTELDISAVAMEIEDLIRPQADAKAITLLATRCDVMVRADPERLRQILLNLLSNAVKFTGEGGTIGIECEETGAVTRLMIWDTGRGIPESQLARIFEPFVQVERALTTPAPDGVGLGLAISRHLARAMEGDLTVASSLGAGSRFTLTLPSAGRGVGQPAEA